MNFKVTPILDSLKGKYSFIDNALIEAIGLAVSKNVYVRLRMRPCYTYKLDPQRTGTYCDRLGNDYERIYAE